MRLRSFLAAGTALCTVLTGCMVGPDFQRPAPPDASTYLPDATSNFVAADVPGGEAQQLVQGLDIPGQWWGVFK